MTTGWHHEQTSVADLTGKLGGLGDRHERVPVTTGDQGRRADPAQVGRP